jgi:predicted nucleic acid-binding Zn ribbon protein
MKQKIANTALDFAIALARIFSVRKCEHCGLRRARKGSQFCSTRCEVNDNNARRNDGLYDRLY